MSVDNLLVLIKKNIFISYIHTFLKIEKKENFKFSYCNYGGNFISSFENEKVLGRNFIQKKSKKWTTNFKKFY